MFLRQSTVNDKLSSISSSTYLHCLIVVVSLGFSSLELK